uniref:SAP domain-containing protein n=1 Tax=Oryza punctata TaxID=4537 RepID=A0A0E0M6B9_ORYPU
MFRNKVLVRAVPSASAPPFLLRQLSFPAAVAALDLDILCCRLSRRHRLACLSQPPSDVLVVYQRCQSCAAAEAVSEIAAAFEGAAVGEEEEVVCSGSLVAKALECGLRSLMLEHGWWCLGESVYVLSTFAANADRTDQCAVNVEVKLGRNDDIEFAVSPDALRFTAHKFADFVSSDKVETFENGKEVTLDYRNFRTVCTTLPTLQEGHVIGFSKILPTGQCLDKFVQLWSLKRQTTVIMQQSELVTNLPMKYGCLVHLFSKVQGSNQPPNLLEHRGQSWNFFGQNQLVIKEQLLLNCTATLPTWDKAMSSARTNNSEDLGLTFTLRNLMFYVLQVSNHGIPKFRSQVYLLTMMALAIEKAPSIMIAKPSPLLEPIYATQVALLKPSFSRGKSEEGHKRKHSSEHSDADNSHKLRHTSLTYSTLVSGGHERKHAESLDRNYQKVWKGLLTKGKFGYKQEDIKDCIPQVPDETRAIPGVKSDTLSTKVMKPTLKCVVSNDETTAPSNSKTKQKVRKDELTAVTKPTIRTEDVKDQFTKKVVDHQKDELAKKATKAKGRRLVNSTELTSMNSKTNSDVFNDDIVRKVTDHHKRGELRLLTVADLKCFLCARKMKVGGTKEMLTKRVAELIG